MHLSHPHKFFANVGLYNVRDTIYYRLFKTTLTKKAVAWFNQFISLEYKWYSRHGPAKGFEIILHQLEVPQDSLSPF